MIRNSSLLRSNSRFLSYPRLRSVKNGQKDFCRAFNAGPKFRSSWNPATKLGLSIFCAPLLLCGGMLTLTSFHNDPLFGNSNNLKASRKRKTLEDAIQESRDLVQRVKDEVGAPGIVVGVSVDGEQVWKEGFGFSDVENRVPCNSETVTRIASISKVITMTIVAKLMEGGLLDIDQPVQNFVKDFPEKTFDGEKVTITTRHLLSHLSGIRHYEKAEEIRQKKEKKEREKKEGKKVNNNETVSEMKEFHIKDSFASVTEALKLFKDDELIHKPGTKHLYTTHGWTLVSAVLESTTKKEFPELLRSLFKDLGMMRTYLDENEPLIYGRSRYYMKNKKGRIVNCPYVDNSYKWAGGGLLSNISDLLTFGNVMLYSYQWQPSDNTSERSIQTDISNKKVEVSCENSDFKSQVDERTRGLPGYLTRKTVIDVWTPNEKAKCSWDTDGYFGLGWAVVPHKKIHGCGREQRFYISHTGGAVGASSVLVILPRESEELSKDVPPSGVVVAIFTNLTSVGLAKVAKEVAVRFEEVNSQSRNNL